MKVKVKTSFFDRRNYEQCGETETFMMDTNDHKFRFLRDKTLEEIKTILIGSLLSRLPLGMIVHMWAREIE